MDLKNGYPYWLIKNGLPYDYPKLEKDISTDVLIIGGGISGALTAYLLTISGIDCIVVDKRTIGLGSTCASTSLLQYELDIPLVKLAETMGFRAAARAYQLCAEAIEDLKEIMQRIKYKDFQKCGSLYYAAKPEHEALLKDEFTIRKKAGFTVDYLNAEEVNNQYGFKSYGAIYSQHGACADAYKLTHHILQYCMNKGLEIYDRTEVCDITYHEEGITATTKNNVTINARKIVNATGYEVMHMINKPIVSLHSTYAVISEHISTPDLWPNKCMIWNTDEPYLYMRMTNDNRIVVGGKDEYFYNPENRDELIKSKTEALREEFKTLFPEIPFEVEFSWTGTFGTTKDALPYIGSLPEFPHTYFALGFGGNGITFSLIAAEIIRDKILGHQNRDEALFSFERTSIGGNENNTASLAIAS